MTTVRVSLLQTEHGQVGASLTSLHCTPLYRVYTTTLLLTTTYPHTTPHHTNTNLLRRAEFDLNHPWIPCYAGRLGG